MVLMGKLNSGVTRESGWDTFPFAPTQPFPISALFTTLFTIIPSRLLSPSFHISLAAAGHVLSEPYCTYSCTLEQPTRLPPPCHLYSFHLLFMTAPTQGLPPWLSDSTSVVTNAAGEPTSTFTTVVNLSLTYFGPSVSRSNLQSRYHEARRLPHGLRSSKGRCKMMWSG